MPSKESIEELSSLKNSSCSILSVGGRRLSLWFSRFAPSWWGWQPWSSVTEAAFLGLTSCTLGDLEVRVTGLHFVTLFSEFVMKLWSLKFVLLDTTQRAGLLKITPLLMFSFLLACSDIWDLRMWMLVWAQGLWPVTSYSPHVQCGAQLCPVRALRVALALTLLDAAVGGVSLRLVKVLLLAFLGLFRLWVPEGIQDELLRHDVHHLLPGVENPLESPDVVDGNVEKVYFCQLLTLPLSNAQARARGEGDGVLESVIRHIDLPHPHSLPCIGRFPSVFWHLGGWALGPRAPLPPQPVLVVCPPLWPGLTSEFVFCRGCIGLASLLCLVWLGDGVAPVDLEDVPHADPSDGPVSLRLSVTWPRPTKDKVTLTTHTRESGACPGADTLTPRLPEANCRVGWHQLGPGPAPVNISLSALSSAGCWGTIMTSSPWVSSEQLQPWPWQYGTFLNM